MSGAADKLRALCVGHPHAKVKWPHRELHEVADVIDQLATALEDCMAAFPISTVGDLEVDEAMAAGRAALNKAGAS